MGGVCRTQRGGEKREYVSVENPEGKIPFERLKRKRKDGVKIYFKYMKWVYAVLNFLPRVLCPSLNTRHLT